MRVRRSRSRTPPDLVLMDIGLPGMCGLEATRRLRADPATRQIPIWAVTARALKEDEDAARTAGCDFYITKPFDQEDLGYMVKFVVAATIPAAKTRSELTDRRPR